MTAALSRRAALTGAVASVALVGAAVGVAAPAVAAASPASKVEAAFTEWKAIRHAINTCPDDSMEPASHPIWARLNEAERVILETDEYGARIGEIRLWVSVVCDLLYVDEGRAVEMEDADWLIANASDPEPSTIMALYAIKALRGAA